MSSEALRFSGKAALVTGAASGIGQGAALRLAQEGTFVHCADVNLPGAEETARRITAAGGKGTAVRLDVTDEGNWEAAVQAALEQKEKLDVVVNAAGIPFGARVAEMKLEDWRRVMQVNLDGVFLGTKHAIRAMEPRGAGSIVNVSSVAGIRVQAGASAYSTSKAAVTFFSKVAAKECANAGTRIRVNTVSPAGVKTPVWKTFAPFQELMAKLGSEEAAFAAMAQNAPQKRFAEIEEVAAAIAFLASDEASYINGEDLVIDAGFGL